MDLPLPTTEADPLAQPTRARLFATLAELKRPAGTVELAERLGLHPNGVRAHLDRLDQAGLIERTRTPHGRGRPRDAWALARGARPGGRPPRAYGDLGRWLARAVGPGARRGLRDVEATGREIGREIAPRDGAGPEALESTLVVLGFQPERHDEPHGHATFCLGNCPYRDAVRESPQLICTLHRGITRGLVDVLDPGAELDGFVARDPDAAGCRVEVGARRPDGRRSRRQPPAAGRPMRRRDDGRGRGVTLDA